MEAILVVEFMCVELFYFPILLMSVGPPVSLVRNEFFVSLARDLIILILSENQLLFSLIFFSY